MGMYTELNVNVGLKKETPSTVIATLRYLVGEDVEATAEAHELDKMYGDSGEPFRFCCGSSYYFSPAESASKLRFDEIADHYYLTVLASIKNYSSTWENFIEWLTPFIDENEGYIGTMRYEEDMLPTMLILVNGEVKHIRAPQPELA